MQIKTNDRSLETKGKRIDMKNRKKENGMEAVNHERGKRERKGE